MTTLAILGIFVGMIAILTLLFGVTGTDAIFPTILVIVGVWAAFYTYNLAWKQEAIRNGVAHWESVTSEGGSIENKFVWDTKKK